jgi:hypothetical protein
VLGRYGWWPTSGPAPAGPAPVSGLRRGARRVHLRQRRPGTVNE